MLLSDLRTMSRLYVPAAKASVITSTVLDLLINAGIVDVAAITAVLKTSKAFNVTAETGTYNISSFVTDFLTPDYPGLLWYDGSNWKRLVPETLESLDSKFPYWRDDSSGDPLRYSIDGDVITVHPKPDTTLTSGFKLYYAKTPTTLSTATHYAFSTSTSPIPHLEILSEAVLKYVRWKLAPIIGSAEVDVIAAENDYKKELGGKIRLLNRRLDIFGYERLKKSRITVPESF